MEFEDNSANFRLPSNPSNTAKIPEKQKKAIFPNNIDSKKDFRHIGGFQSVMIEKFDDFYSNAIEFTVFNFS